VLIELYMVLVIIYWVILLFKAGVKRCKRLPDRIKHLVEGFAEAVGGILFWNIPFRFMLEGYLELAVDCFINLQPLLSGQVGFSDLEGEESVHEVTSYVWAIIMLLFLLSYPFVILYTLS